MRYLFFTTLILFLISTPPLKAQNVKPLQMGSIEFVRKINLYKLYQDNSQSLELVKKNNQQFKTSFFNLIFDSTKTLYKPGKENSENYKFNAIVAEENIVYSELETGICFTQKKILENIFLIQDTIRNIQWKLTGEKRQIAGYDCKRANAIIMDSLYVVAYFTEEILPEGGPESFAGLPGMILGVAMPHEHVTWFATTVSILEKSPVFLIPMKGKKISVSYLKEILKKDLVGYSNWYFKFSSL